MAEQINEKMDCEPFIDALLGSAGINAQIQNIEPLSVSGNNRTYRLVTSEGIFLTKQYFVHSGDSRDRLGSEYNFLTFAARAAPGWAPLPITADHEHGLGLYEFINGQSFYPGEVSAEHVDSATRFFLALNEPGHRVLAQLPKASEACFSIDEHLSLIDARLVKLLEIEQNVPEDREAHDLVVDLLLRWQSIKELIHSGASKAGIGIMARLKSSQLCISPSDFGFHNALKLPDGQIKFLDFEYAGWDDPAKMSGDFFAQLAVPVPGVFFESFVESCLSLFDRSEELLARARLLRPAYQIKWCCIALNVFLPISFARRKFANPDLDERSLKREQLDKTIQLFQTIQI